MKRLQIGRYLFAPKLVPTIAAVILVPFLVSLGLWQLDRADQKIVIDNGVKQAQMKDALDLNKYLTNSATGISTESKQGKAFKSLVPKEIYRSATLLGHYDSDHQYLLDNRTHKGLAGFHVLTPFVLKDTDIIIFVNRGWIGYKDTRENIPDISVPKDDITITGVMKAQGRAIVLNENDNVLDKTEASYPKLIQSIQLSELAKDLASVKSSESKKVNTANLSSVLLPIFIELDRDDKTGFIRDWQPYYGSIDKHNAYALQWFAMALILLFLFIKLNTKKIKL